jgi:hypothetical protein
MIDAKKVTEALAQQSKNQCTHPTDKIIDRPDRSYCRACGEDVPKLMRDIERKAKVDAAVQQHYDKQMDWMGRIPTRMGVFPSAGE